MAEEPRHYKLALHEKIAMGLEKASRLGVQEEFIAQLDSLMEYPAVQYRPMPQALLFHKSNKKFRFSCGGNRSGKSGSVAQEVFWYCTGTHPFKKITTPNIGWYCTITWDLVGSILWEKMEKLFAPMMAQGMVRIVWRNRAKKIPDSVFVKVKGGESKIEFKAYEQGADIFQGTERRYIANDEQFPHDVWLEQISRIGASGELDVFAAMTPIKPQNWLQEKLTISIPPDYDVFEYPLDDNRVSCGGFIADSEIDRIIEEWPEEVRATRRNGKWGSFVGAVYKSFSRQIHIVKQSDEIKFIPRPNFLSQLMTIRAIDFGAADPFVCLWAVKIPHMDNAWYVYDEYYWDSKAKGQQRLLKDHAAAILDTDKRWKNAPLRTWADHDRQDRFELHACGVMTLPAKKDDKLEGIEIVQGLLNHSEKEPVRKPMLYFAERCVNCIREISSYRWKDPTANRNVNDLPVDKDDHTCDTLLYLCRSEHKMNSSGQILGTGDKRSF